LGGKVHSKIVQAPAAERLRLQKKVAIIFRKASREIVFQG